MIPCQLSIIVIFAQMQPLFILQGTMIIIKRIIFSLVLICFLDAICLAQENKLRNPFESWFHIRRKMQEREKTRHQGEQEAQKPKAVELKLTGILQGKRNIAVINGEVVGEGDIIAGKKVVQIEKKKAVLKGPSDTEDIILEIKDEY